MKSKMEKDMEKMHQIWLDEEFIVMVEKKAGKENTNHHYIGSKDGIRTAIASMTQMILENNILTPAEFEDAIQSGLSAIKRKGNK